MLSFTGRNRDGLRLAFPPLDFPRLPVYLDYLLPVRGGGDWSWKDFLVRKRIGIRREDKNPWERRVPLIPSHVGELIRNHPLEFWIQPSSIRIFQDQDYAREGARVQEDLSSCDIVLAVKEIPMSFFRPHGVYLFFSHTIKGQPHNMAMLRTMVERKCTLVDYERIVDENNARLVFFGTQAGQAGMIDTLWALGQRLKALSIENPFAAIRKAYEYQSLVAAKEDIIRVGGKIRNQGLHPQIVPLVSGFAGYGRVSQGAQEIYDLLPVEEVSPQDLVSWIASKNYASNRVYKAVFEEKHMVAPLSEDHAFELNDYYENPEKYRPVFEGYLSHLTLLVNAIYWSPRYPRFVTKEALKKLWTGASRPRLLVIGDISCDVDGSVECTVRTTDPESPVFMYDPISGMTEEGVHGRGVVVMAVDNLPAEIALESSLFFSESLKPLIPEIAAADFSGRFEDCRLPNPVKRAVILYNGTFTKNYEYMRPFILKP